MIYNDLRGPFLTPARTAAGRDGMHGAGAWGGDFPGAFHGGRGPGGKEMSKRCHADIFHMAS